MNQITITEGLTEFDPMDLLVSRCQEAAKSKLEDDLHSTHELLLSTRNAINSALDFLERGMHLDGVNNCRDLLSSNDELLASVANDIKAVESDHGVRYLGLDGFTELKASDPTVWDLLFIFRNVHLLGVYTRPGPYSRTDRKRCLPFAETFRIDVEFGWIHPIRKCDLLGSILFDIRDITEKDSKVSGSTGLATFKRFSRLSPDQWDILYVMYEFSDLTPGWEIDAVVDDYLGRFLDQDYVAGILRRLNHSDD